jgi:DNA (cytosine-5)-methyltransferase 1
MDEMTATEREARPRLLDLFCGAGGAAVGYHGAGFEVVGVDIEPQPNYPFEFIQADAMTFVAEGRIDAIHASPPCQAHLRGLRSVNRGLGRMDSHVDLIEPTRQAILAAGLPYVIENIVGAPLRNPVRLCGSSFGLAVQRHRLFESNVPIMVSPCAHHLQRERRYWTSWRPGGEKVLAKVVQVYGNAGDHKTWGPAMGIDWMTPNELREAIPPAYTEHIGYFLMAEIQARSVALEAGERDG